ncbi:MAG: Hsp20/alpha crystallin family protein [Alphaproteobacteria bacterium]|nr:Hsp20/alpha crystallin family protein [Alphaproteobacteria bacterium]
MREEMNRLLDSFFVPMATPAGRVYDLDPFHRWGGPFGLLGEMSPQIDVVETDVAFEINAELPGMTEADVEITCRDDVLSIKGEKKVEHEEKGSNYHLMERRFGSFQRSFRVPKDVDVDKIKARFGNGVLNLSLPKMMKAESVRKIEVKKSD